MEELQPRASRRLGVLVTAPTPVRQILPVSTGLGPCSPEVVSYCKILQLRLQRREITSLGLKCVKVSTVCINDIPTNNQVQTQPALTTSRPPMTSIW